MAKILHFMGMMEAWAWAWALEGDEHEIPLHWRREFKQQCLQAGLLCRYLFDFLCLSNRLGKDRTCRSLTRHTGPFQLSSFPTATQFCFG